MTSKTPDPGNRTERVLAYMVAGVVGLSIVAFIAIIAATASGMQQADFGQGLWPLVTVFPLIGLPVGFLLIIVLMILSGIRRGREARQAKQ
ncbi:multidrug ABC transporter ATPase [Luethyella okanaganae]|uniref:Multidrug ABC transporter ATPase n=1 Tax=Luethyella okanaganae TaxID=69372 RepID=A0ABW1VKD4_9MICO